MKDINNGARRVAQGVLAARRRLVLGVSGGALALPTVFVGVPASAQDTPMPTSASATIPVPPPAGTAATPPTSSTTPPAGAVPSESTVGDIVVTAQRREESLSHVGISVAAVGSAELQSRGVATLQDLAKIVPGLQASATFGGNPVYTLRGVGFNSRNASSTSPVGIYMSETAVPYPYMSLGLIYDLERVEVLKGPQGTLYGRNATAGLINYVTARPTNEPHAGLEMEGGSYDTLNVRGYVSGPLNDTVRLRLAFQSLNRGEGYQHSITRDESLGRLYQKSARLTADIGNGGPFSATLTGNYWKRTGDTTATQAVYYITGANPVLAAFSNPLALASIQPHPTSNTAVDWYSAGRQTQAGIGILHPGPLVDSDFYSASAKLGYRLSDTVRLQSLTSYEYLRQRDVSDASGLQTDTLELDSRNRIRSTSQELRLIGESDRLNWSIGGYYGNDKTSSYEFTYQNENATINRLRQIGASVVPHPAYTNQQILVGFGNVRDEASNTTNVYAGFLNAEYRIDDLFKISTGGRYTWDTIDFSGCSYDTDGVSVPFINTVYRLFGVRTNLLPNQCFTLNAAGTDFVRTAVTNSIRQNNFAWRTNLDVTPSSHTLLYGSISRGYKSGGFPILPASSASQFDPVKQEELTAYEIGAKLGLFDRRVQLNLAGFYYDYKNKQVFGRVLDPIFGNLSRIRNVPKSRELGVEGEVTWRITNELTAHASATYLGSKVLQFNDYTELGVPADIRGQPFPYTPRFTTAGTLSYDGRLTDGYRLFIDVDVNYQTKSQADSAGIAALAIKAYGLVDGDIGLRLNDNSVRLSFYGRNLLNTYYWTGASSSTDTVFRFPGMPRELGLRLTTKF